eukprot:1789394-Rhodomonas_salina.2
MQPARCPSRALLAVCRAGSHPSTALPRSTPDLASSCRTLDDGNRCTIASALSPPSLFSAFPPRARVSTSRRSRAQAARAQHTRGSHSLPCHPRAQRCLSPRHASPPPQTAAPSHCSQTLARSSLHPPPPPRCSCIPPEIDARSRCAPSLRARAARRASALRHLSSVPLQARQTPLRSTASPPSSRRGPPESLSPSETPPSSRARPPCVRALAEHHRALAQRAPGAGGPRLRSQKPCSGHRRAQTRPFSRRTRSRSRGQRPSLSPEAGRPLPLARRLARSARSDEQACGERAPASLLLVRRPHGTARAPRAGPSRSRAASPSSH